VSDERGCSPKLSKSRQKYLVSSGLFSKMFDIAGFPIQRRGLRQIQQKAGHPRRVSGIGFSSQSFQYRSGGGSAH
jgi:hypothetical protein